MIYCIWEGSCEITGVACRQQCHGAGAGAGAGGDGSGTVVVISLMDRLEGGSAFLCIIHEIIDTQCLHHRTLELKECFNNSFYGVNLYM